MALLEKIKYEFISQSPGIDDDTFAVVSFTGQEAISALYDFEIILVTEDPDVDDTQILENPASLIIHRDQNDPVVFNGILAEFEEQKEYNGIIFYRARIVPRAWWLTLTHHNQVCLDKTVRDILEQTLKDGGLFAGIDFDFDLVQTYMSIEYVCQYKESHFDFASRWAQREGIYYYFAQTDQSEKLIFTDTRIAHKDLKLGDTLIYSPVSGLDSQSTDEVIHAFTSRRKMLPANVLLKDYNYQRPSLEMTGEAQVDLKGKGTRYLYGEYFNSPEEGRRLAQLRAEELLCGKIRFSGESSVPFISPGYRFELTDHYRDRYNTKYLVTAVSHKGHQKGYLTSGLGEILSAEEERMLYNNQFSAIPADVQFRPELTIERPRISGTIHANIDALGTGEYAELDGQGRYKVRLPFDLNDEHGDGKASAYVRMMQPYAGANEGMHFPLRKGTEVLLTFIDGNPDRPVIAGAIPNPETISPVTAANQTESVIKTKGDNKIRIEDKEDNERIIMQSPKVNSYVRIGTPNDPDDYATFAVNSIIITKDQSLPPNWKACTVKPPYILAASLNVLTFPPAGPANAGEKRIYIQSSEKGVEASSPGDYTIIHTITVFEVKAVTDDQNTTRYAWEKTKTEKKTVPVKVIDGDIDVPVNPIYIVKGNQVPSYWKDYNLRYGTSEDSSLKDDADATGETENDIRIRVDISKKADIKTDTAGNYTITFTVTRFKVEKNASGALKWKKQGNPDVKTREVYVTEEHYLDIEDGPGIKMQTEGGLEMYTGDTGMSLETPQDINIGTEDGHINIIAKKGSNKDVVIQAQDIKEETFGDSYLKMAGDWWENTFGERFEASFGNFCELKVGTAQELFIGSAIELALASKLELFYGTSMELGYSAKFEKTAGPEYEDSAGAWDKHSDESITMDAQKNIEVIAGKYNNSKIIGSKDSLTFQYGKHGESSADKLWQEYWPRALIMMGIHLATIAALATVEGTSDGLLGDGYKPVKTGVDGTSALLSIAGTIGGLLYYGISEVIKRKKEQAAYELITEKTESEIDIHESIILTCFKDEVYNLSESKIQMNKGFIKVNGGYVLLESEDDSQIMLSDYIVLKAKKDLQFSGNMIHKNLTVKK